LSAIFLHLEKTALRLSGAAGPAREIESVAKLYELLTGSKPQESGLHRGLSFRQLGRQVLQTAQAQVRVLQERTHEVQSLLLINDWPVAKRLWPPLQAESRTPLYELNFLENFWGLDEQQLAVNSRHRRQFALIQADVRLLLARQESLLDLSNTLERDLGCWLTHFGRILQNLDEETLA
jgi:hypothetical protein